MTRSIKWTRMMRKGECFRLKMKQKESDVIGFAAASYEKWLWTFPDFPKGRLAFADWKEVSMVKHLYRRRFKNLHVVTSLSLDACLEGIFKFQLLKYSARIILCACINIYFEIQASNTLYPVCFWGLNCRAVCFNVTYLTKLCLMAAPLTSLPFKHQH